MEHSSARNDSEEYPVVELVQVGPCNEEVVSGLIAAIEQMAEISGASEQMMSRFVSKRRPGISIADYVKRLRQFFFCSMESFVLCMIYIDRLAQRRKDVVAVSPLSAHRLLACALTLAAKFHDDVFYSNAYYAKVAGFRLQDFNQLEKEMLQLLDSRLFVTPAEFELYRGVLVSAASAAARPAAPSSAAAELGPAA